MLYISQLNEAELGVSGDTASYKDKLEVLQQQQELIEDEAEQEQEEEEARQAKKAKKELEDKTKRETEAKKAQDMLPASEVSRWRETVDRGLALTWYICWNVCSWRVLNLWKRRMVE